MQTQLDLTADIIDICDIFARVEELEDARLDFTAPNRDGYQTTIGAAEIWDRQNPEDAAELVALTAILDKLKGNSGDEQWCGDWYPLYLIADSHFTAYAREMLEDCGDIPRDIPHYIEIDWNATARNVRTDYTPIDIDDATYWYR